MTRPQLLADHDKLAGATQQQWEVFLERQAKRPAKARQPKPGTTDALPLEVNGVRVQFGGVVALDQPDIVVRRGEIVGLIGTNGAGKTTLMNVISGIIKPQSGSVRLFGSEVGDLAPDFRAAYGTARSFQDASLFAGLTVLETIQVAMARTNKVEEFLDSFKVVAGGSPRTAAAPANQPAARPPAPKAASGVPPGSTPF